jgi:hypothetical protein
MPYILEKAEQESPMKRLCMIEIGIVLVVCHPLCFFVALDMSNAKSALDSFILS